MTDEAESSVQSILNEFHLKNENISKLSSVYDDLDSLVQLVRRGQTNITLHCIDREELGQTNQKSAITPYDSELIRLENEYDNKSEKDKYLTNDRFIAYRQHIWNVKNSDEEMPPLTGEDNTDDEIVMGRTKLSFKCPITTSWLEQPLTSKTCKHSFTKTAIIQLIQINRGMVVCPVSGCNKIVKKDILYDDEILADKVKRAKAKAEEESLATEFYDVE
ncbi:hypothetical protein RO3G_15847 [Rhizopus delemar RA 99-880]|uniref:SP-RING-type domain-containing protein n=1 Tax=Rhizopus delemar (strain RA 99-880 / ATCC MYA-4621 / FGSC 9543 / NRRL 43880) TaxID=246409 RepID=I1CRQ6_RHIO9|nr:hypothetical protein RO3G_15847 [Rhizopus delemar RA 99-880]|eukprot:EIE91136.1 hypothetical protein RO3G_15847 [Rhizopus delemar RA 99-880]